MTITLTTLSDSLAAHAVEQLEAAAKTAGAPVQPGDYLTAMGAMIDAADRMVQMAYPDDNKRSLRVLQQTLSRMAKIAGRKAGTAR